MSRAEKVLLGALLAMVLFSPVFLGGVAGFTREWRGVAPGSLERFLWADGAYAMLAGLAVLAAAAGVLVARERAASGEPAPLRLHPLLLGPLLGLGALAALHLAPLPRPLLGHVSPGAAGGLAWLLPGDDAWRPLTLSSSGTRAFLAGLGMGGATLLGTLLVARRRGPALALLGAAVAAYAGSAAYGLWSTYLGDDTVWGFGRGESTGVTGTFLNRSHLAAGAALALPVALALLVPALRAARDRVPGAVLGVAGLLGAAALLAVVVPLTRSRMGLASAAGGLGVLGLLAARAVRWPPWAKGLLALVLLAGAGWGTKVALDRVPELRQRFAMGVTEKGFFDIRFPAWRSTLALASRYPALGTGFGSYEVAVHETQGPENPDELIHAHCEPLEFLAEGGVPGLLVAALLAAGGLAACLRAAGGKDPWVRAAGCGCGGGLAALLAGSLVEFHFRIPALGIAAAVAAGVPAALAAGPPRRGAAGPARPRWLLPVLGAAVLLAGVSLGQRAEAAALRGAAIRGEMGRDPAAWVAAAREAAAAAPGDALVQRSLAKALLAAEPDPDPDLAREALAAADRAVDLEPFHPWGHYHRAEALLALGREEAAAAALVRVRTRAGGIGHLLQAAGERLLLLSLTEPRHREEAYATLREAGATVPQHFSRTWALLETLEIPPEERERAVPDRVHAWWTVADFWRGRKVPEREVAALARAANLSPRIPSLREACLRRARAHGLEDLATRLLEEGQLGQVR